MIGLGSQVSAGQRVQQMNPNDILFSLPTIADDAAPLEPFSGKTAGGDPIFHEDEWRQVEFLPGERLGEVERMLGELKAFAGAHRRSVGWDNVYARKLAPLPVLAGEGAVKSLEATLGATAGLAPLVFTGANTIIGRIAHGFSLSLGGGVTLYGFRDGAGMEVLGVDMAPGADDRVLTRAFAKLNASDRLILVDWRAQMALTAVQADGRLSVFKP